MDGARTAVVATHQGVPVHISWAYLPGDLSCGLPLQPSECVVSHCYTNPAHRGRGLQAASVSALARKMAGAGVVRMYAAVAYDNTASIRGLAKCGMRRVGAFREIRVCGCRLLTVIASWK